MDHWYIKYLKTFQHILKFFWRWPILPDRTKTWCSWVSKTHEHNNKNYSNIKSDCLRAYEKYVVFTSLQSELNKVWKYVSVIFQHISISVPNLKKNRWSSLPGSVRFHMEYGYFTICLTLSISGEISGRISGSGAFRISGSGFLRPDLSGIRIRQKK